MRRNRHSRSVLHEAGIFLPRHLSNWAREHGLIDIYIDFHSSRLTRPHQCWVLMEHNHPTHRFDATLSKSNSLQWAKDWTSSKHAVARWGQLEGLPGHFPLTTLEEFQRHYPDVTIKSTKLVNRY